MTTPQITPNSVMMNPAEVNPHAQAAQIMTVAKAKSAFLKSEEKMKSDSVNISEEALRMAKNAEGLDEDHDYEHDRSTEEDDKEKV